MKDIPDEARVVLAEGQALTEFMASPGAEVVKKVLNEEAKRLLLALLSCKLEELPEWRGRLQAIFGVMDGLSGRIEAAEHLATRIRDEVEADRERDRATLEQEIERRERPSHQRSFEREGTY